MWRYLEGGKRLAASADTDKRKKQKASYEEKRERPFLKQWQVDRDWLVFDSSENVMYCSVYRDTLAHELPTKGHQTMVVGSQNFKKSTITDHENSLLHKSRSKPSKINTIETTAGKTVLQMKQYDINKLMLKFRNAHFIAKHAKSFCDYTKLCELDEVKGLDVGHTYRTDKYSAVFIQFIAASVNEETRGNMADAKFISLTCDGAIDWAGNEFESLYLRTSIRGTIYQRFLGLKSPATLDAIGVCDAMLSIAGNFMDTTDMMAKLVGFGSDGASVMTGKKAGVVALLKKQQEELIDVHCLAHRLELSFKSAVNELSLYTKVMTLLMGLYHLYRRSSKLKKALSVK